MNPFKLKIHNDGKEKHNSFEARIYDEDDNYELVGYGEDIPEAIADVKKEIDEEIKRINKLKDIDFTNDINPYVFVSWDGKLIEKN